MSCGFVESGQGMQCFLKKGEALLVRPEESQGCRVSKFPLCPVRSNCVGQQDGSAAKGICYTNLIDGAQCPELP